MIPRHRQECCNRRWGPKTTTRATYAYFVFIVLSLGDQQAPFPTCPPSPLTTPWAASSSIERSRRGAKGPDQSYALGCYVYCINAMFRLLTMGGEGQLRTSRLFSSLWKNNSLYSKFPDPILASKSEGTLDHTYFRTENQGTPNSNNNNNNAFTSC